MTSPTDRVVGLRQEADRLAGDVTRLDALAEASAERLAQAKTELVRLGFDVDVDLAAQLAERSARIERQLAGIREDVDAIRQEAQL